MACKTYSPHATENMIRPIDLIRQISLVGPNSQLLPLMTTS